MMARKLCFPVPSSVGVIGQWVILIPTVPAALGSPKEQGMAWLTPGLKFYQTIYCRFMQKIFPSVFVMANSTTTVKRKTQDYKNLLFFPYLYHVQQEYPTVEGGNSDTCARYKDNCILFLIVVINISFFFSYYKWTNTTYCLLIKVCDLRSGRCPRRFCSVFNSRKLGNV